MTFNWQARLARLAEIELAERESRRRQRRVELEEANWETGSLLRERCNEFSALLEEFKQTRTETIQNEDGSETRLIYLALNANIDQIARGLKIADELQQRSVEISEEETKDARNNGGSLIRRLVHELDELVGQRQVQSSSNADGDGEA